MCALWGAYTMEWSYWVISYKYIHLYLVENAKHFSKMIVLIYTLTAMCISSCISSSSATYKCLCYNCKFFFFFCHTTQHMEFLWPWIEPISSQWKRRVLTTGPPGTFYNWKFFLSPSPPHFLFFSRYLSMTLRRYLSKSLVR